MKVLFLTRYGLLGASSRVRAFQYLPYLKRHGVDARVSALLDDSYVRRLYAKDRRRWWNVAAAYPRRLLKLRESRSYDLIWIEKEIFPMVPSIAEAVLRPSGIPYVLDCDDAVFHRYDRHPRRVIRLALARKIDQVMRDAALVIAGNEYIADRARLAGARSVEVLPSVVDLDRYPEDPSSRAGNSPFTIAWIGSPATRHFLALLEEPLRRLSSGGEVILRAIGAGAAPLRGIQVETHDWSRETEVALLTTCDVGVMPLFDEPFERGKCGYKLIQYMGCHLPVVASPVGANNQIVEEGVNGFLARTPKDWIDALATLRDSPSLRREMGMRGRSKVETRYDLKVTAPRLHRLLSSAMSGTNPRSQASVHAAPESA